MSVSGCFSVVLVTRYVLDDVVRLGAHYDKDRDNMVSLEEIYHTAFGQVEGETSITEQCSSPPLVAGAGSNCCYN